MGTWGYKALDSDAALDVQHIWESYIQEKVRTGSWDEKTIVDYFVKKRWGDAINCGDNITNGEVIALVEILRSENLKIPSSLRRIAEDAINRELVDGELNAWAEPRRREAELLKMLQLIGGKRKRPKAIRLLSDPSASFKNTAIAERELLKLTKFGKKLMFHYDISNNPELSAVLPDFIKTLNRFVHHGLWEKDSNVSIEITAQRNMMIAYYLGMSLGYDEEAIRQMIKDAKWEK
jgi:hypothetical protein